MSNIKKSFKKNIKTVFSVICTLAILLSVATSTLITASAADYSAATISAAKKAAKVSKDQAKEIALNDAGLAGTKVWFTKQSFDIDDGVSVYEIEFRANGTKYEYEIDANSGAIRDRDSEKVWSFKQAFEEFKNKILSFFGFFKSAKITTDQAKEIALADAKLKASDVKFTKQHLDRDDSTPVYEIEFISGKIEYDYEINGLDGRIIEKSVESIYA